MSSPTHKCPKRGCDLQVRQDQLACTRHWYSVPKALRDEVNRAYRRGTPDEHRAAMAAAVESMNRVP